MFFHDQVILRILIICGSSTYIAYYYLAPSAPLWDPLIWSSVFVMINVLMIFRLLYDRVGIYKNEHERQLYRMFYDFNPGMFRQLMSTSTLENAQSITVLTKEGEPLDKLYFVINGGIRIEKSGRIFDHMPGAFIGEVAYLTGEFASATVSIPTDSTYIVWDHQSLKALTQRKPGLKARLEAMFNQDMALKVRFS